MLPFVIQGITLNTQSVTSTSLKDSANRQIANYDKNKHESSALQYDNQLKGICPILGRKNPYVTYFWEHEIK